MAVEAASASSATQVTGAIRRAAQLTGTSFHYLLATAQVESNFNPKASVSTSSARGLFQFIEQTWLSTIKDAGPALGYGQYADAIVRTPSGRMVVADADLRREILNLRHDAGANAAMAGAFTRSNAAKLNARLGRPPTEGELYMAHFLGPNGAAKLIAAAAADPQAKAADAFPHAARANSAIFFGRKGEARSLAQVADMLAGKYDMARAAASSTLQVASAGPANAVVPAAQAVSAPPEKFGHRVLSLIAAMAGAMPALSADPAAAVSAGSALAAIEPATSTLGYAAEPERASLRTAAIFGPERAEALAPLVRELWGVRGAAAFGAEAPLSAGFTRKANGQGLLDLFRDAPANVRGLFTRT
jgi:hypothetical protein